MVRPCQHEELAPVADRVPVEVESACRVDKRVVVPDRRGVHLVVLVEESLVAGLGELHKPEDPGELAPGGDGAKGGRDRRGGESDGREGVDTVRRPGRVDHGELRAGRARCML